MLLERKERYQLESNTFGKTLSGKKESVSLGCSPFHFRFFCFWQLKALYAWNSEIIYEGLQHIPKDRACIFVMKHRGYSDITLHGFGNAWATSDETYNETQNKLPENVKIRKILSEGKMCRFLMKEDLLSLPIGAHLVINGGIPILQDHETKALNNPEYNPDDPSVKDKIKKMSTWFSFKDSYREILDSLKQSQSIMIYGEATRVAGNKMGHLSLKFLKRLTKNDDTCFIPVGSTWKGKQKIIRYGLPCELDQLRDHIAELSEIPKSNYIP